MKKNNSKPVQADKLASGADSTKASAPSRSAVAVGMTNIVKVRQLQSLRSKHSASDCADFFFSELENIFDLHGVKGPQYSSVATDGAEEFFFMNPRVGVCGTLALFTYALELSLCFKDLFCKPSRKQVRQQEICSSLANLDDVFSIDPVTGKFVLLKVAKKLKFDMQRRHDEFFRDTLESNYHRICLHLECERLKQSMASMPVMAEAMECDNQFNHSYLDGGDNADYRDPITTAIAIVPGFRGAIAVHTFGKPVITYRMPATPDALIKLLTKIIMVPALTSAIVNWMGRSSLFEPWPPRVPFNFSPNADLILGILRMYGVRTYSVLPGHWGTDFFSKNETAVDFAKSHFPHVRCTSSNSYVLRLLNYFENSILPYEPPIYVPVLAHPPCD